MTAIECAFNGGNAIVSVASIIASGLIGYCSARRISDKNTRATASAKLRAAFAPAQVKLSMHRELRNDEIMKYFDEAFFLHSAAVEEFRPFASDGNAYQKAYEEYRNALYGEDALGNAELRWFSGMMADEHGTDTLDFLEVIQQKIKSILKHA